MYKKDDKVNVGTKYLKQASSNVRFKEILERKRRRKEWLGRRESAKRVRPVRSKKDIERLG